MNVKQLHIESISEYEIQNIIGESRQAIVYRAGVKGQPKTVIIKALRSFYPSQVEIAVVKSEYQALNTIDIEGILKPIDFINFEKGVAIVFEDFLRNPYLYFEIASNLIRYENNREPNRE